MFKRSYEIAQDGRPVTELAGIRRESCEFVLGGVPYSVVRDGRKRFTLSGPDGRMADAVRDTSRRWAVTTAEGGLELVKPSFWRSGWEVRRGGAAGAIEHEGVFTRSFTAEVPAGVSLPVQVFVLYVVLMILERQQQAAASAGAASAGSS